MQKISREEYEEWRTSFITEQLFNFFKLEAELQRRICLEIDISKPLAELGEEYYKRQFAAQCYDMLGSIEYTDIFPQEGFNEGGEGD